MRVVGISGSIREGSFSSMALRLALKKASARGVEVELVDLRSLNLPFCSGEEEYLDYPDVELLRKMIANADGLIFSSPEYHGTVSGVLKNALDLLTIKQVKGKVVGLIAVLGGAQGMGALDTLRTICRHLHAWVVPEQVLISHAELAFDERGAIIDPLLDERIKHMVEQLIDTAEKFQNRLY